MTVPTVGCTNCGKSFTTDDLRGTSCRYCGTLLAHHARAAQQVAVIHQMMADRNGNGIPDAYEGLVANAQANALNQAFGIGPHPYGPPPPMMAPVAQVHPADMQVAQATRTMGKVVLIAGIAAAVAALLVVVLAGVMLFVARG